MIKVFRQIQNPCKPGDYWGRHFIPIPLFFIDQSLQKLAYNAG